jgi:thiamine-phosphate pyrophosphorylase
MLCYYITDRRQFAGDARTQRQRLLAKIAEAARAGVDFIQLRERDLTVRDLEALARECVEVIRQATGAGVAGRPNPACACGAGEAADARPGAGPLPAARRQRPTLLLINSRTDIALAAGAGGVHLRGDDIPASEARVIWDKAAKRTGGLPSSRGPLVVGVSCHAPDEVRRAEAHGADFAVFAPVFAKVMAPQRPGVGVEALREACRRPGAPLNVEGPGAGPMPVLALGGITLDNACTCLEAGAAGIAGIRLFQENDVQETLAQLQELEKKTYHRATETQRHRSGR